MPRRNLYILLVAAAAGIMCSARAWRYGQALRFAVSEICHRYLEPVSEEELFYGAMEGMVGRLDEFSSYIPPELATAFNETIEQQFGGIGVEIHLDPETKELTVASPLFGSPAFEAGIRAGDRIVRINGESTQGMSLADAGERLRGKPGQPVTLTVLHYGEQEPVEITIVRAKIQVDTVLGDTRNPDGTWNFLLDRPGCDGIGYVRINAFTQNTPEELRRAIDGLLEQGMKALVLDLRNNPGGLLNPAVSVCDMFINSGVIVSTRRRDGEIYQLHTATKDDTFPEFPMAVLVNRDTASAAEIVAACLQDHHRAVIIGERTFGKGTVQDLITMPGRLGVLKLTMASYWRPSGKNIHRFADATEEDDWGVRPDKGYELKLTEEQFAELVRRRAERDRVMLGPGPGEEPAAAEPPQVDDPQLDMALERLQQVITRSEAKPKAA